MSHRLLVLGWHNIEPTWAFGGTSPAAGRRGFERQVRFLRRWANVVPLRAALVDLLDGRALPPRAVALTFDDGYRDNVTTAAPLLRAAGLHATFFLVPGFLSGTSEVWWENLGWAFAHATAAELSWEGERFDTSTPDVRRRVMEVVVRKVKTLDSRDRENAVVDVAQRLLPVGPTRGPGRQFMDWDEADRLVEYGHDIGSHTCSHPILSREEPADQARELVDSREQLEAHFQRPVDVFAFPNGRAEDYSEVTLRLIREAGYTFAVTTRTALAHRDTPAREVPRVLVNAETGVVKIGRSGVRTVRRILAPGNRTAVNRVPIGFGRDRGPSPEGWEHPVSGGGSLERSIPPLLHRAFHPPVPRAHQLGSLPSLWLRDLRGRQTHNGNPMGYGGRGWPGAGKDADSGAAPGLDDSSPGTP
jgi:peptidoglycan/xylan/chitin deacetylase (PgdA/CDA1 family)